MAFWPYVLLPLFLGNLGYDSFMIGVLMGTASVSGVLIRPWIGVRLDRQGRKPLLIGAASLFVGVNLGYILVDETGPLIYGIRLLHGLSIGPLFAAIMTFAADIIPEERRTEGFAYFGIAGHLSGSISVMLGEWMIWLGGFSALFISGAVMSLIAVIFFSMLSEPDFKRLEKSSPSLWEIAKDQRFVVLWIVSLSFSLGLTSYFIFLKPFAETVGLTNVSFFFTTYSSVAVLIRLFGARLPQQLGEKKVLSISLGCLAIGILMISHLPTIWGLMFTGMLCGTGHGYGFPILSSILIKNTSRKIRGSVITFYTLLFDIGFLIGAPLWGLLVTISGYNMMFLTAALMIIGGILLVLHRQ